MFKECLRARHRRGPSDQFSKMRLELLEEGPEGAGSPPPPCENTAKGTSYREGPSADSESAAALPWTPQCPELQATDLYLKITLSKLLCYDRADDMGPDVYHFISSPFFLVYLSTNTYIFCYLNCYSLTILFLLFICIQFLRVVCVCDVCRHLCCGTQVKTTEQLGAVGSCPGFVCLVSAT